MSLTPEHHRILAASGRLGEERFSGLAERYFDETDPPLLAGDCGLEIFDGGSMKPHPKLAAVLTPTRLVALRGRGLLGGRRPFVLDLDELEEVGVTRQGNLSLKFVGQYGRPGLWKLRPEGPADADRWMEAVRQTRERGGDAARGEADEPRSPSEVALFRRVHDLTDALRPLATAEHLGRPFGERHGLEAATRLVDLHLDGIDDVRVCGKLAMVELITETEDDAADRIKAVMGDADTDPSTASARDLGGAALTLLGQFEGPGSLWDLWLRRDDVPVEMLCWHTVARLRLATGGVMKPLVRPDWA